MLLLLLEQRHRVHDSAVAASQNVELTVAEGHVEDDAVGLLAAGACGGQLSQTVLQVAVALDIDLALADDFDNLQVRLHAVLHLRQANQHLFAAILHPVGPEEVVLLTDRLLRKMALQLLGLTDEAADAMEAKLCLALPIANVLAEV